MIHKFHFYLFIAINMLVACQNNNKQKAGNEADTFDNKDQEVIFIQRAYSLNEFEICNPDSSLIPMFDEIVRFADSCPYLSNMALLYDLSIYKDQDSLTRFRIFLVEQKSVYCRSVNKIVVYKGKVFNISAGKQFEYLFIDSGSKYALKCQEDNSVMFDYNDNFEAFWEYIYISTPKCVQYSICDKRWRDENYFSD